MNQTPPDIFRYWRDRSPYYIVVEFSNMKGRTGTYTYQLTCESPCIVTRTEDDNCTAIVVKQGEFNPFDSKDVLLSDSLRFSEWSALRIYKSNAIPPSVLLSS
jgi:hypothetical protein